MTEQYRCWAEIDRSALRHNAAVVRERIGCADMLAVVKADAYGHGLVGVVQTLVDDARLFGIANSDEDAQYTRDQLARFGNIVRRLRAEVKGDYKAHVLQSAGTLAFNQEPFEIVRAGIMLYGVSPLPQFQNVLRPVMTWKTRVGLIRNMPKGSSISYGRTYITPHPMRVATLTAGYADGYPRHLSNRDAAVLVRGQRCPLLGRVT